MSKELNSTFVSIIIVKNDINKKKMTPSLNNLYQYLNASYNDWEIIIVDDTPPQLKQFDYSKILKTIPSIRVIQLSSRVDYELACAVGLENAIGDYVFLYDLHHDSVELIAKSIQKSKEGFDIVAGVDKTPKTSLAYKVIRPLISRLLKLIGYHAHRNITKFYCLSRVAVNAITITASKKYQLRIKILQSGLIMGYLPYEKNNPEIKTVIKSIPDLLNMIVFNSVKPLRLVTLMAICVSLVSLVYAIYSFLQKMFNNLVVDGWASTTILVSIMFTFLFIILAFFAEYLSRLLDENNKYESYKIINELNSAVMVNEERLNVVDKSQ